MRSVTSGFDTSSKNFSLNHAISRRTSTRSAIEAGNSRRSPASRPCVSSRYSAMIPAPGIGGKPSAINTGVVAAGLSTRNRFAPFPGPLFHQAQVEAVFAQHQANEARMRTERVMIERVHEIP